VGGFRVLWGNKQYKMDSRSIALAVVKLVSIYHGAGGVASTSTRFVLILLLGGQAPHTVKIVGSGSELKGAQILPLIES
jgi:hypothetical protein